MKFLLLLYGKLSVNHSFSCTKHILCHKKHLIRTLINVLLYFVNRETLNYVTPVTFCPRKHKDFPFFHAQESNGMFNFVHRIDSTIMHLMGRLISVTKCIFQINTFIFSTKCIS